MESELEKPSQMYKKSDCLVERLRQIRNIIKKTKYEDYKHAIIDTSLFWGVLLHRIESLEKRD